MSNAQNKSNIAQQNIFVELQTILFKNVHSQNSQKNLHTF